jgi:hypothetical protein
VGSWCPKARGRSDAVVILVKKSLPEIKNKLEELGVIFRDEGGRVHVESLNSSQRNAKCVTGNIITY